MAPFKQRVHELDLVVAIKLFLIEAYKLGHFTNEVDVSTCLMQLEHSAIRIDLGPEGKPALGGIRLAGVDQFMAAAAEFRSHDRRCNNAEPGQHGVWLYGARDKLKDQLFVEYGRDIGELCQRSGGNFRRAIGRLRLQIQTYITKVLVTEENLPIAC